MAMVGILVSLLLAASSVRADAVVSTQQSTPASAPPGAREIAVLSDDDDDDDGSDYATCLIYLRGECKANFYPDAYYECECADGSERSGEKPASDEEVDPPTPKERCVEILREECEAQPAGPDSLHCDGADGGCTVRVNGASRRGCSDGSGSVGAGIPGARLSEWQMQDRCEHCLAYCSCGHDDDDDDDDDDCEDDPDASDDDDTDPERMARGCSAPARPVPAPGVAAILYSLCVVRRRRRLR